MMKKSMTCSLALAIALVLGTFTTGPQPVSAAACNSNGIIQFNSSSYTGVINNGTTDVTNQLEQAANDAYEQSCMLFIPAGTYLVSRPIVLKQINGGLKRSKAFVIRGHSEHPSIIKLKDNATGFGDAQNPKVLLKIMNENNFTGSTYEQPNMSFNNMLINLDFNLGSGNAGAIAIRHQSAQGSVIEDVSITATNANGALQPFFAGVQGIPGSGGSIAGLTVNGGKYGIYASTNFRGSQPGPTVSSSTFKNQTDSAIYYNGRGPMTVVGAWIEDSGIVAEGNYNGGENRPSDGGLNLIDSVIKYNGSATAVIRSNRSVYMREVYIQNAPTLVRTTNSVNGNQLNLVQGTSNGWSKVNEVALAGVAQYPSSIMNGVEKTDQIRVNGGTVSSVINVTNSFTGTVLTKASIQAKHGWPSPFPMWNGTDSRNVKSSPYLAAGDGIADDWVAIQSAIDDAAAASGGNGVVFLPKGDYKISKPLILKANVRLFGVGNIFTRIFADMNSPSFSNNGTTPNPLIQTPDNASNSPILAFLRLHIPTNVTNQYALWWRAGGNNAIVRNVNVHWDHPLFQSSSSNPNPYIKITGHGGGKWYNTYQEFGAVSQPHSFRALYVNNTYRPLKFYQLNTEHPRTYYVTDFHNAQNVDVFGFKYEGAGRITDTSTHDAVGIRDSNNIRLYGWAGIGNGYNGSNLLRIVNSSNILVTNLQQELRSVTPTNGLSNCVDEPYGCSYSPTTWNSLRELNYNVSPVRDVQIKGTERITMYKRGNP